MGWRGGHTTISLCPCEGYCVWLHGWRFKGTPGTLLKGTQIQGGTIVTHREAVRQSDSQTRRAVTLTQICWCRFCSFFFFGRLDCPDIHVYCYCDTFTQSNLQWLFDLIEWTLFLNILEAYIYGSILLKDVYRKMLGRWGYDGESNTRSAVLHPPEAWPSVWPGITLYGYCRNTIGVCVCGSVGSWFVVVVPLM